MATTIQIVLRKDKLTKKGEAPLYFRIIKNRRSTHIFTGFRIMEKDWDDVRKKVKTTHPNSARLNNLLKKKEAAFMDGLMEAEADDLTSSLRVIKNKLNGINHADLFQVADTIIHSYKTHGQISSYDKAKTIIKKLRDYHGRNTLLFTDVDVQYIKKYSEYLVSKKGNAPNTVHKDLKFIRQVFLTALREGTIEQKNNPFGRIRLKTVKTTREYLLQDEIDAMFKLDLSVDPVLEKHRDMFVFSCYACGLRISDVLLLQCQNITGNRMNITIQKTGAQMSLYLPLKAMQIVNKYRKTESQPASYVFGCINPDTVRNDPTAIDRAISGATAAINRSLKLIAGMAGIQKHLTFHVSRHSFATNALRKGIPLEHVQKLLGHANIRETQIYAKIVSADLDQSMFKFDDE